MDSMHEKEGILARAVHAPSGDNAQPWRFKIEGDSIAVFNVGGRDATLYNFKERGSYLAHGALCENIAIAARSAGFQAQVTPFPGHADQTAQITLMKASVEPDPLNEQIEKRTTNRKPYNGKPLSDHDREMLVASVSSPHARLVLTQDVDSVNRLAATVNLNERLLFENKNLHDFLFGMIRWSTKEEQEKPGLYVKTMEFPLPLQFLLKHVFTYWGVVRMLNRIGLSKGIPAQTAELYRTSAAFGAIIIDSNDNEAFFEGGRALQRFWLTATKLGVSFQPVTGIPYLGQRIAEGEAQEISEDHQDLIVKANETIADVLGIASNETVAMLFRIGYADAPTASSAKLPPVIS